MTASQRIDKATRSIYKLAQKKAETEREYRIALGQEKFKLKEDGLPITLIDDIAKANTAALKFERDLAEDTFKAAIESLRALQAELSGLQTISKYQSDV
jgi:hypothetical protein